MKTEKVTVWHANSLRFDAPLLWPRDYTAVAVVEIPYGEIGAVFQLTNHIDHDWTENPEVTKLASGPVRSTSVGDIYEHGTLTLVKPVGLTPLKDDPVTGRWLPITFDTLYGD